jgi:hypothetical protein
MKGIKFLTNDKNERIAVQIDLAHLEKHRGEIEDLLDVIISESRKDDESVSWDRAKDELMPRGKRS